MLRAYLVLFILKAFRRSKQGFQSVVFPLTDDFYTFCSTSQSRHRFSKMYDQHHTKSNSSTGLMLLDHDVHPWHGPVTKR